VHSDERVVPLILDITYAAQIQAAANLVEDLDLLINNAGVALYDDLSDREAIEKSLNVNFYGPYDVTRAFLPQLVRSKGAIVNNVSIMALAPFPMTPAYALSKAATFNLTQSLRALLAKQDISVYAILTGPTDTDMTKGFEIPKTSPDSVAKAIFEGIVNGEEEIFPDPMTAPLADGWRSGAIKAMEQQNALFVQ